MSRILCSTLLCLSFAACGPADFTGTYSASGESVWTVIADGQRLQKRFSVSPTVVIRPSNTTYADYEITVDDCTLYLMVRQPRVADVRAGTRCVYQLDGYNFAETYNSGRVDVDPEEGTASYGAVGTLSMMSSSGSYVEVGTVQVQASMSKTSEWIDSQYGAAVPSEGGTKREVATEASR